jgi:hypothetical protein
MKRTAVFATVRISDEITIRNQSGRVLKNLEESQMAIARLSTPCVKTGFLPNLLSRLRRDKSEGAGC